MIKNILKQNNITLVQFANDLNISRPTLDVYIKNYSNGLELSNPLFQKIFDFLFEDTSITNDEFMNRYEYVKTYYGKKDSSLSLLHSNSISSQEVKEDEYEIKCNFIIEMLEKSKGLNRFAYDKLKVIEKLLLEDTPEFETVWRGKRYCVLKRKNYTTFTCCLILNIDEQDGFRSEEVIFDNEYKYSIFREDESAEYLISLAKFMDERC